MANPTRMDYILRDGADARVRAAKRDAVSAKNLGTAATLAIVTAAKRVCVAVEGTDTNYTTYLGVAADVIADATTNAIDTTTIPVLGYDEADGDTSLYDTSPYFSYMVDNGDVYADSPMAVRTHFARQSLRVGLRARHRSFMTTLRNGNGTDHSNQIWPIIREALAAFVDFRRIGFTAYELAEKRALANVGLAEDPAVTIWQEFLDATAGMTMTGYIPNSVGADAQSIMANLQLADDAWASFRERMMENLPGPIHAEPANDTAIRRVDWGVNWVWP
jgi:hypothetical protein